MKNYKGFRGFVKRLSYKYDKSQEVDATKEKK